MQNLFVSRSDRHLIQREKPLLMADARQRAWIEVESSAIESNTHSLRNVIADSCLLMAVVKADGYGHGAETVARAAINGGADNLGVATLQEGIELRLAGLNCPILLLGNLIKPDELRACLHWRLMPTLSNIREALICQEIAESVGLQFNVHLKVDTGMTRLGCDLNLALALISQIDDLNNLVLKGVYSHLALADNESSTVTRQQQQKFEKLLTAMGERRKEVCCHLANSAGTLREASLHYDMVRVGLAIYGYTPIAHLKTNLGLKPALALKARVTFIRQVPKGVGVSYGHAFITQRPTRLAVVGIGYADGVNRALSGRISALINGYSLPQVGSITMDQLVLDATDCPELEVGSVVTLLGSDGDNSITPQHWSDLSGSIPWEVLCGFKNRLPRIVI